MRTNFNPAFCLHECTSNDDLRPAFGYIHFYNGYAYATDAHVIVKAKIEDISNFIASDIEMINNHSILAANFKKLIKHQNIEVTPEGFVFEDYDKQMKVHYLWNEIIQEEKDGKLCRYVSITGKGGKIYIPNFDAVIVDSEHIHTTDSIGIKHKLISSVAKAMGADTLAFYFSGDDKMIKCRIKDGFDPDADIVAGIMPNLIDHNERHYKKVTFIDEYENAFGKQDEK